MATPNSGKPTPARARRATQTIDEIEARAAEIVEAERASLQRLAAFLRNEAVELPVESKMPLRLAKAAKTVSLFVDGSSQEAGISCGLDSLIRDLGDEHDARLVQEVVRAMDACADAKVSVYGKVFGDIADSVRMRLDAQ